MKGFRNTIILKDYYEKVDAIIFTNVSTETIEKAIITAKNEYDEQQLDYGQLNYVLDCLSEQFEIDYIDYNMEEIYY